MSYIPGTAAKAFMRITQGVEPWVALGDFLDDFYDRASEADRRCMIAEELPPATDANQERWAAFFAATVDWLCRSYGLQRPAWTRGPRFVLAHPWFLYPGDVLRAWQLIESPPEFKMRNIFPGDRALNRA